MWLVLARYAVGNLLYGAVATVPMMMMLMTMLMVVMNVMTMMMSTVTCIVQ